MFQFIKNGHIFIVGTALVLFWVPLLSPKGGRVHRAAGKWYAAFMAVAGLSGAYLASTYMRTPSKRLDGVFLLYALWVYFSVGWNALRALKAKELGEPLRRPADILIDVLCVGGGIGVTFLGIKFHDDYLLVTGPVGLIAGIRHLYVLARREHRKDWWLREHRAGMIMTGVAGYFALIFFEILR